ncbi:MAG: M48 family metallopeptidase [Cyclobacteriaceae bacterium]
MKKILLAHLFSIVFCQAFSQLDKNYKPAISQNTVPSAIYDKLLKRKSAADESIHESAKVTAFIKELNQQRFNLVVHNFNDDLFITDAEFSPYLQSILNTIQKANPELPEASVYVYRSETANAMSFGNGVIGFTLGLLARLESEDQIAFALCHELAHYFAKHAEAKTLNFARLNYDKEVRKKIKAIERSEFNQYSKLSQLSLDLGQSIGKHSREKEFEADSIGLQFFLKTSYNKKAAVRTLEILDSADLSLYDKSIEFKKYFNSKQYPFKDEWLNFPSSDMVYYNPLKNDSLRTHPSCEKRILATKRQMSRVANLSSANETENKLKAKSEFEILESAYKYKAYGRALFLSLELVNKYPDNVYLHSRLIDCLDGIYVSQKNHELSRAVSLPDPHYYENYNQLLSFIHNLRLSEIGSIVYFYAADKKELFFDDEEFIYAYWLTCAETSREDAALIKNIISLDFLKESTRLK